MEEEIYYPDYNDTDFNEIINKYEFRDIDEKDYVYQNSRQLFVRNFISKNTIYDNILLFHDVGSGKCMKIDTPILMFDGSIKKIQDIKVGELLMGDDSKPRKVLSLARGTDSMYDVIPVKGDKYTVNKEHILCLKATGYPRFNTNDNKHNKSFNILWIENNSFNSKTFTFNKTNKKEKEEEATTFFKSLRNEQIIEIAVKDYLKLSNNKKALLKGYKVPISFPTVGLPMDPYMIGFWLGDGTANSSEITTQDSTVIKYFKENLQQYNNNESDNKMKYRINGDGSRKKNSNHFFNILTSQNLINNKHIPHIYKCNSRENRLKLLAGLIDSDGSLDRNGSGFEFSQSLDHGQLMDDVVYLCRSLGFACYKNKKKTYWTYKGIKKYGEAWRIVISGKGIEEIPTKIPRKQAKSRQQIKDVLSTGITVKYVNRDEYYGFILNGNSRYVMGDFTVTHNTGSAISIAEGFKEYLSNMNRKILVLVKNDNIRKNFMNELISDFTRNAYLDEETKKELQNKNITPERKAEILNKLVRKINKTYTFMTYGSFVNQVLGMKEFEKDSMGFNVQTQNRSRGRLTNLNNNVIIIDEVHNVTNNPTYTALEKVLRNSYNYRLVLLTATPMYDNPKEMVEITNLLNMNKPDLLLPIRNDLFKKYQGNYIMSKNESQNLGLIKGNIVEITDYGKKLLKPRLLGKVSYLAANTDTFPVKIDEGTSLIEGEIGSMNIVECEMSEYQTSIYKIALESDTRVFGESDLNDIANNLDSNGSNSSSLYHNSSGASVFVYPADPDSLGRNAYGKDGFLKFFVKTGKTKLGKDIYQIKPEHKNILTVDLPIFSSKLQLLLKNISAMENKPGNIFIYSNYVEYNGTELLRQLLLNNGYHEFQNKSQAETYPQHCFIMYDSTYSAEKREQLRKIYNSKENKDGRYIKIIIGSPIISEGITLKNTRQVHILEPSWNMSKINQIIGRAVRHYSHNDLDPIYRNVEIYKYCSIPTVDALKASSELQSIDKQKYILSEYKDRSNKSVERLLKEIAVDCFINKDIKRHNQIEGSAECDYTDCNYKCDIKGSNLPQDKSTYNLYIDFFEKFDIEYTTTFIKKLFKTYFVWSIDDIIDRIKIKTQISNESVFTSLNNLINNKVIITDLYGRDGFLIQKDMYIIFNPLEQDINKSIFGKVLDFETNINKYTLSEFVQSKLKTDINEAPKEKETKKKISVVLSEGDKKYNQKIIKNNLLYGHFRDKGLDGNFGQIDGKFRIVDVRKMKKEDADDDKRRNITGMAITSIKKGQLINIIDYLQITPELVLNRQYIGYNGNIVFDKLNTVQLSQIIQRHLEKEKLILR
jgi:superfamily II DNA or RNA helicase